MTAEYKAGFDEGFEFALTYFDANTGYYYISFPDWFNHRKDPKSCGFAEGLISGRADKVAITFGPVRGIYWSKGKPYIEY
jgi:hypothetical protein